MNMSYSEQEKAIHSPHAWIIGSRNVQFKKLGRAALYYMAIVNRDDC